MGVDLSKAAIAILGAVALRAFMNRHEGQQQDQTAGQPGSSGGAAGTGGGGLGGILGNLGGMLGGAAAGGAVSGGLGDLLNGLRQTGHEETANSWVGTGDNKPISPDSLKDAINPNTLNQLAQQTGLSVDELLQRLSQNLPSAIDRMTPHGRVPTEDEASSMWAKPA